MPPRNEPSHVRRAILQSCMLLLAVGIARPSSAASSPAEELIRRTIDSVFAVLRDPALAKDRPRRLQRLREVVDPVFDWTTMARSSLGHHWSRLTPAEQARFVRAFRELLAQRYMDDLDRFRGTEQVRVLGSETVEELTQVHTMLTTSSREQIPIDYSLQAQGEGHRVVDFAIEKVSLVNHYRATFSRYLVNKPFSELLDQLERQLGLS